MLRSFAKRKMSRVHRAKLRRRKRWIALSIVVFFCILFLFILYYRWVQDDFWAARKQIIQQVESAVDFDEVKKVEQFHDDETFWIVTGIDPDGVEHMVWWNEEQNQLLFTLPTDDLISRQVVQQEVLAKNPEADIIRILPARYQETWAWEVFYKYAEGRNQTRYAYDYFELEAGKHLGTLHLAPKRKHS